MPSQFHSSASARTKIGTLAILAVLAGLLVMGMKNGSFRADTPNPNPTATIPDDGIVFGMVSHNNVAQPNVPIFRASGQAGDNDDVVIATSGAVSEAPLPGRENPGPYNYVANNREINRNFTIYAKAADGRRSANVTVTLSGADAVRKDLPLLAAGPPPSPLPEKGAAKVVTRDGSTDVPGGPIYFNRVGGALVAQTTTYEDNNLDPGMYEAKVRFSNPTKPFFRNKNTGECYKFSTTTPIQKDVPGGVAPVEFVFPVILALETDCPVETGTVVVESGELKGNKKLFSPIPGAPFMLTGPADTDKEGLTPQSYPTMRVGSYTVALKSSTFLVGNKQCYTTRTGPQTGILRTGQTLRFQFIIAKTDKKDCDKPKAKLKVTTLVGGTTLAGVDVSATGYVDAAATTKTGKNGHGRTNNSGIATIELEPGYYHIGTDKANYIHDALFMQLPAAQEYSAALNLVSNKVDGPGAILFKAKGFYGENPNVNLPGVVFTYQREGSSSVGTITTGADGMATAPSLASGSYIVKVTKNCYVNLPIPVYRLSRSSDNKVVGTVEVKNGRIVLAFILAPADATCTE